ncbi:MAG TPA: hypothetical protein VME17_17610 [Bryobacteraceae bacterium]|nr:hypothetical protein [Bryobacteraceae bacterium]
MQSTTQNTLSHTTFLGLSLGAQRGLRIRITYGFLILALCLMIADCYRLMRAPAPGAQSPGDYHSGRI